MHITKKKVSGIMTILLTMALLLTGSLAWQDVSQHKTSVFSSRGIEYTVVLVETYKPIDNWQVGPEAIRPHTIAVRNGHDSDPIGQPYGDALVRIQLKQFMAIADRDYELGTQRYMIDTFGDFVRVAYETDVTDTEALAATALYDSSTYKDFFDAAFNAIVAELNAVAIDDLTNEMMVAYIQTRIDLTSSYFDGVDSDNNPIQYWYVKTADGDPNGQYGKFLVKEAEDTNFVSLTDSEVSFDDAEALGRGADEFGHNDKPNNIDEDFYSVKLWHEDATDYDKSAMFDEYIRWGLNTGKVLLYSEWVTAGDPIPVASWIIDDRPEGNGWIYWGMPLKHHLSVDPSGSGSTLIVDETMTSDFLEEVELIKQPTGASIYQIHVNLDAVSREDMAKWDDIGTYEVPEEIKALYVPLKDQLGFLISDAGQILNVLVPKYENYSVVKSGTVLAALENARTLAHTVYNTDDVSHQDIKTQIDTLNLIIPQALDYLLQCIVTSVDTNILESHIVNGWDDLESAKDALSDASVDTLSITSFKALVRTLEEAIEALEYDGFSLAYAKYGYDETEKTFVVDGITFRVLLEKDNCALIIKDSVLTQQDIRNALSNPTYSGNTISYHASGTDYDPGYSGSQLRTVDKWFYDSVIMSLPDVQFVDAVLKVDVLGASGYGVPAVWNQSIQENTTEPEIIKGGTLEKTAFSLSAADVVYISEAEYDVTGDSVVVNFMPPLTTWLRSPGATATDAALLLSSGNLDGNGTVTQSHAVRPALWVSLIND